MEIVAREKDRNDKTTNATMWWTRKTDRNNKIEEQIALNEFKVTLWAFESLLCKVCKTNFTGSISRSNKAFHRETLKFK